MLSELTSHIPDIEDLVLENFQFILDRNAKRPDYKFVDTKVKILDGSEFPEDASGTIYGRDVVYAFIQGRGLESIAEHARWIQGLSLPSERKSACEKQCLTMLRDVINSVQRARRRNHGHVRFMMDWDGAPLQVIEDRRVAPLNDGVVAPNLNDVFMAKGLFAAAAHLGDEPLREEAEAYFKTTVKAAFTDEFIIDKQVMDPKNKVGSIPGTKGHGPLMISLGGMALTLRESDDPEWAELAERTIVHIMSNHLNTDQFPELSPLDFFELADADGLPWKNDGIILCDPGHCLEFIGLACKVLKALPGKEDLKATCADVFPKLFVHMFDLGFNHETGGICKAYDLIGRKVCNSDMPWWNLPETMRAGALLLELFPETSGREITDRFELARRAFFDHYLNPNLHRLAYQTRAASGEVIDVIPAVPDADPCYHTGLSLLDVLATLQNA